MAGLNPALDQRDAAPLWRLSHWFRAHRAGFIKFNKSAEYFLILEVPAKLSKTGGSCHSGQAKRHPESRIFKEFWIPAFVGMTA
jgi:hypothetical protein